MKDLENRADIEKLVNHFYLKVQKDETIGFIFNEVAKIDWKTHLPKMYDFWDSVLFSTAIFKGNPMHKHLLLSDLTQMSEKQFSIWINLWEATVDELFLGNNANEIKNKAKSIAQLMQIKISQYQSK